MHNSTLAEGPVSLAGRVRCSEFYGAVPRASQPFHGFRLSALARPCCLTTAERNDSTDTWKVLWKYVPLSTLWSRRLCRAPEQTFQLHPMPGSGPRDFRLFVLHSISAFLLFPANHSCRQSARPLPGVIRDVMCNASEPHFRVGFYLKELL